MNSAISAAEKGGRWDVVADSAGEFWSLKPGKPHGTTGPCLEGRDGSGTVLSLCAFFAFFFHDWGLATSWRVWRETAKENSPLAEDCTLTFAFWTKNTVQWCAWTGAACWVIPLYFTYVTLCWSCQGDYLHRCHQCLCLLATLSIHKTCGVDLPGSGNKVQGQWSVARCYQGQCSTNTINILSNFQNFKFLCASWFWGVFFKVGSGVGSFCWDDTWSPWLLWSWNSSGKCVILLSASPWSSTYHGDVGRLSAKVF